MKKFIICLFMSVFMISCVNTPTNTPEGLTEAKTSILIDDISQSVNISKYTFEGHDYQFHAIHPGLRSGIGGPIHDPECRKCKQDTTK